MEVTAGNEVIEAIVTTYIALNHGREWADAISFHEGRANVATFVRPMMPQRLLITRAKQCAFRAW